MPVIISNQILGPVGQYSSKHPRPREVIHPWRLNGSVAMGACTERFTHFLRFLHLLLGGRQQLAVTQRAILMKDLV